MARVEQSAFDSFCAGDDYRYRFHMKDGHTITLDQKGRLNVWRDGIRSEPATSFEAEHAIAIALKEVGGDPDAYDAHATQEENGEWWVSVTHRDDRDVIGAGSTYVIRDGRVVRRIGHR